MVVVKEVTVWKMEGKQPNHVYLLDGDRVVAYQKWGEGDPIYNKYRPRLDKRYRKFVEVKSHPFKMEETKSNLIKITGSKGNTYFVDPDKQTCTCTGFQFRKTCKHITQALAS